MLKAVSELFDRLNRERVPYCHWKSNRRLDRALDGRTELDLLVDRSQSRRFKQILYDLAIKPFVSERAKRCAGPEDYLGFDEESGRLFHLHVHYQLVLGERDVKNYRLPLEDSFLGNYLGILASRRLRRWLSLSPAKKVPVTGGAVIAIVGADGAGKSTMVEELRTWLSWKVDTHRCYMGTGEHLPVLCRQLRRVSRFASRLHRISVRLLGEKNAVAKVLRSPHFLAESLFHVSVAAMRARRHRESRRRAAQGSLVLTDRYPLPGIWKHMTGPVAPMDGPRIAWMSRNGNPGRVEAYLARKEEALYDTIGPPDCIVLLHVTAETALRRKPDHDPGVVKAKLLAVERLEDSALHIIDVDSNRPFEEALKAVKQAIWARL